MRKRLGLQVFRVIAGNFALKHQLSEKNVSKKNIHFTFRVYVINDLFKWLFESPSEFKS